MRIYLFWLQCYDYKTVFDIWLHSMNLSVKIIVEFHRADADVKTPWISEKNNGYKPQSCWHFVFGVRFFVFLMHTHVINLRTSLTPLYALSKAYRLAYIICLDRWWDLHFLLTTTSTAVKVNWVAQGNNGSLWRGLNTGLIDIHRIRVRRTNHWTTPPLTITYILY